ncbi:MAG: DUF2807 domain-containing protein [Pseudomonadota bacterium]
MRLAMIGAAITVVATASPALSAERDYDLDGFTGVNVARGVVLTLTMGPPAIQAETNADDFSDLYVEVDDGVLEVRRRSTFSNEKSNRVTYDVTVSAPEIDFLKASTGATLIGDDLTIDKAAIELNTGATMTLSGACRAIGVKAHTGAEFDGRDLLCKSVIAYGRTGATIRAHASDFAEGRARMGAEIKFDGDPKERKNGTFLGGAVSF